jgi:hypothetical protein
VSCNTSHCQSCRRVVPQSRFRSNYTGAVRSTASITAAQQASPSGCARMSPVLASPADSDTSSRALFTRPEPAAALTLLLKVNTGWLPGSSEADGGLTAWETVMSGVSCRHKQGS